MNAENLHKAAAALVSARNAIASTGAGISVESGIPDFRSEGGIWSKYPPEEYATIHAFLANPRKVWGLWRDLHAQVSACRPNPAHAALARLEAAGRLKAVITQNVDNLHQEAGSRTVVEYHGNARHVVCLSCRRTQPITHALSADGTPFCLCGGLLKPDVVMFGEMIPSRAMLAAEGFAQIADVVLVVGTSASVYPAAELPYTAKRHGAVVIECNIEPTEFTDTITDVFLQGPAGTTLAHLADAVLAEFPR